MGGVAGWPPRIESQVPSPAATSSPEIPMMANTRERNPRWDHRLVGLDPETCVGHIQRTLEPPFPSRQRGGSTVLTGPTLCQTPNKDPGLSGGKHRRRRTLAKPRLLHQANRKTR